MTQDEIIEMARQAGLSVENPQYGYTERHHVAGWITDLEAFAKLVAAKEREACAKVCEGGISNATDWDSSYWDQACENRAAAIRARGQA